MKKQIISFGLSLFVLSGICCTSAYADGDEQEYLYRRDEKREGDWVYLDSDAFGKTQPRIIGYIGEVTDEEIVFPTEIDGQTMTKVFSVLSKNGPITKVVFPESYTEIATVLSEAVKLKSMRCLSDNFKIAHNAFYSIDKNLKPLKFSLKEVELSPNCSIANMAFYLTPLEKVVFRDGGDSIYIGTKAFMKCGELKNIDFPENTKEITIENNAFSESGLTTLTLPASIKSLGSCAFENCTDLKSVTFKGNTLVTVYTFNGCSSLADITFEAPPTKLMNAAFANCSALSNINTDISQPVAGYGLSGCPSLMTVNSKNVVNEDGSLVPEFEDFIKKNFYNADDIGFLNKYVSYRIKQAVDEVVSDNMTDMAKLRAVHDKLCSMTTYDNDNYSAVKNHVDASIFLNDSTVCEGYARALNLMLHEVGIESCYVNSTDHAWVIVKLGDHYFHVDPTWDDGETISYNWFMKSDSQIKTDPSHSKWNILKPSSMHSFQWDEMPECTELMGDVTCNGILDAVDASAILTDYARTSVGKPTEIDNILGDYNFDGKTDGVDASAVLTAYAKSSVDNPVSQ